MEGCKLSTPRGSEFAFILLLGDPNRERLNRGPTTYNPEAYSQSAASRSGFWTSSSSRRVEYLGWNHGLKEPDVVCGRWFSSIPAPLRRGGTGSLRRKLQSTRSFSGFSSPAPNVLHQPPLGDEPPLSPLTLDPGGLPAQAGSVTGADNCSSPSTPPGSEVGLHALVLLREDSAKRCGNPQSYSTPDHPVGTQQPQTAR